MADLSAWDRKAGAQTLSELLAQQTLHGLMAIDAHGPIVLSGPFAKNAAFLDILEGASNAPIHIEENLLGICKGISACIGRLSQEADTA